MTRLLCPYMVGLLPEVQFSLASPRPLGELIVSHLVDLWLGRSVPGLWVRGAASLESPPDLKL
jgi:hypothetical protein